MLKNKREQKKFRWWHFISSNEGTVWVMLGTKCNFGAVELQSETIKKKVWNSNADNPIRWILQLDTVRSLLTLRNNYAGFSYISVYLIICSKGKVHNCVSKWAGDSSRDVYFHFHEF